MEIAAAILIMVASTDVVLSFGSLGASSSPDARLVAALSVGVGAGLVLVGLLLRSGRAWLVALNVVAVAAFLELRSLTLAGLFLAVLDMVVVGILLRERWWFRWRPTAAPTRMPPRSTGPGTAG